MMDSFLLGTETIIHTFPSGCDGAIPSGTTTVIFNGVSAGFDVV
jgi:hypothetical protein